VQGVEGGNYTTVLRSRYFQCFHLSLVSLPLSFFPPPGILPYSFPTVFSLLSPFILPLFSALSATFLSFYPSALSSFPSHAFFLSSYFFLYIFLSSFPLSFFLLSIFTLVPLVSLCSTCQREKV
jgi:hypothetical protein